MAEPQPSAAFNPSNSDPPIQSESDSPHGALFLVLHYLPLRDLLVFEVVSHAFCQAVSDDASLWQHISVNRPLSWKLTDRSLLKITSRAQGRLKSLDINDCYNITDAGLRRVIEQNSGITKLFVPGCISISANGIIDLVKLVREKKGNLNRLKIHGLCNVKKEHLDTLNSLLSKNNAKQFTFYVSDRSSGDHRPVDLDICRICGSISPVFDCTRHKCRANEEQGRECRACYFCITRCEDCGGCIDRHDANLNDCVCNHLLCPDCWLRAPKCNMCNRPHCQGYKTVVGPDGFVCQSCSHGEFYLPEAGY